MKNLCEYLIESLDSKVVAWMKQVYNTMQKMVQDNKVEPLEINIDELGKPQESFEYDDFMNNGIVKKIISNKSFGFTVTNQMIKMPKKYLINQKEEEIKPKCFPYWYRPTKETNEAEQEKIKPSKDKDLIDPTYFVGIIMYDPNTTYIEDFIDLTSIETSLCVKDSEDLLKGMLNDWSLHYINKEGNYKGISSKPLHAKMKATLMKLGFTPSKDNKEILYYKL